MRHWLQAVLLVVVVGLVTPPAHAQPYPTKPVRIVVPSTAGDDSDVLARTLANALTRSLDQSCSTERAVRDRRTHPPSGGCGTSAPAALAASSP